MREVRNGSFPKPIFKKARQRTPFGLAAAGVRSPLVAELADAYLEWMKAIRSANTYAWYRRLLQKFCAKYPLLKVEELRSFHVQQWVDAPPHLSKSSRRNYIRSVKACVRWA